MSHRYVLWQPESQDGEQVKWKTIPDTPVAREGALADGAMFFSYCTYDEPPLYTEAEQVDVFNRAVIRHADLKFDIDAKGNLDGAADSARRLVARLVDEYGVPERAIRLYYSGGKGFHITVPEYLLGPEAIQGDRLLPLIHKHIVEHLREGIPFIDDCIYNMGRGRQFRIANVLRKNGRHKIEIRLDELNGDDDLGIAPLSLDDFDDMAKAPRFLPELNGFKHEASKKLRALYREGKIKAIESKIEEMKRPPVNEEQVEELKKGLPTCMKQVLSMTDYGHMEGMTFNEMVYSMIVPYFKTIGADKDDTLEMCRDFIVDFTASSYDDAGREKHFIGQWNRPPYAWKCGVMAANLRCDCSGCPVGLKQTIEDFKDVLPSSDPTYLEKISASRFLASKPKPIKWLFKDSLPQGMVGLVAGKGGTCKTFLQMQMEMEVAGIANSLDGLWEVAEHGSVFAIHAEDPDDVLHQRSLDIATAFAPFEYEGDNSLGDIKRWGNWYCTTGVGEGWSLVGLVNGQLVPSAKYLDLLKILKTIPDLKLVVLDPLSRFDQLPGKVDINLQATFFITLMERICVETGASVLVSCHTNKGSAQSNKKGAEASSLGGLTQEAVRGASAYVDGSRWVLGLVTLKAGDATGIGQKASEAQDFVAGQIVKKNHGRPEPIFYLKRTHGGVLRQINASPVPVNKLEAYEKTIELVVQEVTEKAGQGKAITRNSILDDKQGLWATEDKRITRKVVKAAMAAAIELGRILEDEPSDKRSKGLLKPV